MTMYSTPRTKKPKRAIHWNLLSYCGSALTRAQRALRQCGSARPKPVSLLGRRAFLGFLLPLAAGLVDDLRQAAGEAAGADRRAAESAGIAHRLQSLGLVGP